MQIPLHKPWIGEEEIRAATSALRSGSLVGDGYFGKQLRESLGNYLNAHVLPTPSATAALELSALVLGLGSGDEVIMPSFTFTSCANAVMLRGAQPVFAEVEEESGNLDPRAVERVLTATTRAVMVVHYAGVACQVEHIRALLPTERKVYLIEDAAHALGARYKNSFLGTLGDCGAFSFHFTKNLTSGEGGAFVTSDKGLLERAEIIREKGTNRKAFLRGEVDRYTWVDVGSSFLLSDVLAAILLAQLKKIDEIIRRRKTVTHFYLNAFADLCKQGRLILPKIPTDCFTNWHIFWIRVDSTKRDWIVGKLREQGIEAAFHFVPLHLSPMGRKLGYQEGDLPVTEKFAASLIRLPIYPQLTDEELSFIADTVRKIILGL